METKFKYKDIVIITKGFYRGCICTVRDYDETSNTYIIWDLNRFNETYKIKEEDLELCLNIF